MNNSEILNALYESDKELIIYRNSEKNNFNHFLKSKKIFVAGVGLIVFVIGLILYFL